MKAIVFTVSAAAAAAAVQLVLPGTPAQTQRSDAAIRQAIVRESIAAYTGNCPCPYNTDRAGRRCGARSAYSRPRGRAPKCYPRDVSDAEVSAYRRR